MNAADQLPTNQRKIVHDFAAFLEQVTALRVASLAGGTNRRLPNKVKKSSFEFLEAPADRGTSPT